MRQSKIKISSEQHLGHNSYLPMPSIDSFRIFVPDTQHKAVYKNRFSSFIQKLFKSSKTEISQETNITIAAIKRENLPEVIDHDEQSLQKLENCADAARKAEGGEQYDWD